MTDARLIVERAVAKKAQMQNGCYSFSVGELIDLLVLVQEDAVKSKRKKG